MTELERLRLVAAEKCGKCDAGGISIAAMVTCSFRSFSEKICSVVYTFDRHYLAAGSAGGAPETTKKLNKWTEWTKWRSKAQHDRSIAAICQQKNYEMVHTHTHTQPKKMNP